MKKRFGQHFLTDLSILRRIVQLAQIHPEDTVVEIGPGAGSLTRALAAAAKLALEIRNIAGKHSDAVCTMGSLKTFPGIVTAVVGRCEATLDQRDLDAKVLNNQTWSSTDSDTGIEISADARINDDNTVTVAYKVQRGKTLNSSGIFRVKSGEQIKLSIGCAYPFEEEKTYEVKGRDLISLVA